MKIELDKYYTPFETAKHCIEKTKEIIGVENITQWLECSAGSGSFFKQLDNCIAYDIKPECDGVIEADYLKKHIWYKKGRCCIGNPPYGKNSRLIRPFFEKAIKECDYVAWILPINVMRSDFFLYEFDKVYSEDLGIQSYSGVDLHCCFVIYKRPDNKILHTLEDTKFKLKEIRIFERRRKRDEQGNPQIERGENIPTPFDYAICNFGCGCIGKVPQYFGQYSNELYFYCDDEKIREQMIALLQRDKLLEYAKGISTAKISVMGCYKYLYENIEGLTKIKK